MDLVSGRQFGHLERIAQSIRGRIAGKLILWNTLGGTPMESMEIFIFAVDGKHKEDSRRLEVVKPFDDFHIYAIEWDTKQIDFYFDDKKYHTAYLDQATAKDGYNSFRAPHYLLINFALGGGWDGKINDSVLPQQYLIDYVRVYQYTDLMAKTTGLGIN